MKKKKELIITGHYFYNGETKKAAEENTLNMFNNSIKPNISKHFGECLFTIENSEEAPEYNNEAGLGYKIEFKAIFPEPMEELHNKDSDELELLRKLFYAEVSV